MSGSTANKVASILLRKTDRAKRLCGSCKHFDVIERFRMDDKQGGYCLAPLPKGVPKSFRCIRILMFENNGFKCRAWRKK